MWTEITRRKYERGGQRYASDLTDGEWAANRTSHASRQAFGPAAGDRVASGAGRDLVYRADRLSVADAAERQTGRLRRGNRLDQARIVVPDVADARAHRPADHAVGRVAGKQRLQILQSVGCGRS